MSKSNDLSESVIFPKGEQITNGPFTGAVWLDMLVPNESTFDCPTGNVTFEAGHELIGINIRVDSFCLLPAAKDILRKKVSRCE